jgi:hypothetical protein
MSSIVLRRCPAETLEKPPEKIACPDWTVFSAFGVKVWSVGIFDWREDRMKFEMTVSKTVYPGCTTTEQIRQGGFSEIAVTWRAVGVLGKVGRKRHLGTQNDSERV